jgi:hypothetical protein
MQLVDMPLPTERRGRVKQPHRQGKRCHRRGLITSLEPCTVRSALVSSISSTGTNALLTLRKREHLTALHQIIQSLNQGPYAVQPSIAAAIVLRARCASTCSALALCPAPSTHARDAYGTYTMPLWIRQDAERRPPWPSLSKARKSKTPGRLQA